MCIIGVAENGYQVNVPQREKGVHGWELNSQREVIKKSVKNG